MSKKPVPEDVLEKIESLEREKAGLEEKCRAHRKTADLLAAIQEAHSLHLFNRDASEIYSLLLKSFIELTESEFGFLDEVFEDENGQLFKRNLALTNISWDEESNKLYQELQKRDLKFIYLHNLSGLPALTGKTVISNDVSADSRSKGIPQGHPAIQKFMGMPLYFCGELICVAGVANRKEDYRQEMADFLEPLLATCGGITFALRKQAMERENEREIKDTQMKYKALMENFPNGAVVLFDHDLRYVLVDGQGLREVGLDRNEMRGKTIWQVFPEEIIRHIEPDYRAALRGERNVREVPFSDRIYRVYSSPVANDNGKIEYGMAMTQDITREKAVEKRLVKSQNELQSFLNAIPESAFLMEPDGKIQAVNHTAAARLSKSSEEMLGRNIYDFIPEKTAASRKKEVAKVLKTGKVLKFEDQRDGRFFLHSVSPVFGAKGSVEMLAVVGTDVSDVKGFEERLLRAQKMESIGNLAGGIAHDFNNILFPIIGMAELLLEDLAAESIEHENTRQILKAAERGSDLVQQILAFSRQNDHKITPVRIQNVLKDAIRLARSTIPANIEISEEIQRACGLIKGDPTQIHQVALNLMTNAYHAVEEEGGKISVRLTETVVHSGAFPVNGLPPGPYALLSVADTGCGIEPDHLAKIFEPYFTTKEQGKGTGLGLAVVYGIVKAHGGEIRVFSEVGEGTRFDIHFPLMEKPGETGSREKIENYPGGTERILVVDDEAPIVHLEAQVLKRLGYKVQSFTRSQDALDAFRSVPEGFDLVLTDMAMPEMTGLELTEHLKKARPDIPVILFSGFSERLSKQDSSKLNVEGLLKKPISKSKMARAVRDVLDGKPHG